MVNSIWVDLLGAQVHYEGTKYRTRVIEYGEGVPLIRSTAARRPVRFSERGGASLRMGR